MASASPRSSVELNIRRPQITSIEARARSLPDHESRQSEGQSLEPTDGGSSAWRLLFAAFVFEALLYGENLEISTLIQCRALIPGRLPFVLRSFPELLCPAPRVC